MSEATAAAEVLDREQEEAEAQRADVSDIAALKSMTAPEAARMLSGPSSIMYLGRSIESAGLFARIMFAAGIGGENCKSPFDLFARIMIGLEYGIGPMEAIRDVFLIDGKQAFHTRLMLKLARRKGCAIKWNERSTKKASVTITNAQGETESFEYTIEDATTAQLLGKKNWQKYPRLMLSWRCLSEGLNLMTDLGMHTADELGAETDAYGAPLDTGERVDAKKALKEFDAILNGGVEQVSGKKKKEDKPAPEPTPTPGEHKEQANPGIMLALREAAERAGCWMAQIEQVAVNGKLAGDMGLENGAYGLEWLATQVNATEIIDLLNARGAAREEKRQQMEKKIQMELDAE